MGVAKWLEKTIEWFSYRIKLAIVVLGAGYLFYGRWLANKWGLDPKAKNPCLHT